jgi:hypothetical protein
MASKRRGGSRPPVLRGTLGTLLRTTTGVVRDALQRGAREGRARFDSARASRRRLDALADLGELVLDLIRRGEIDLAELPEAHDLVRELDSLDDDGGGPPADGDGAEAEAAAEPEPPRPLTRRRFDDRSRRDADGDGTVSSGAAPRTERPTTPERPRAAPSVTSRTPTKPLRASWRPVADEPDQRSRIERWDATRTAPISRADRVERSERDTERERSDRERAERSQLAAKTERSEPAAKTERPEPAPRAELPDRADRDTERERPGSRPAAGGLPRDPARKGGISFDDEDLADYMHPDDVPPKPPAADPDDHDA